MQIVSMVSWGVGGGKDYARNGGGRNCRFVCTGPRGWLL